MAGSRSTVSDDIVHPEYVMAIGNMATTQPCCRSHSACFSCCSSFALILAVTLPSPPYPNSAKYILQLEMKMINAESVTKGILAGRPLSK